MRGFHSVPLGQGWGAGATARQAAQGRWGQGWKQGIVSQRLALRRPDIFGALIRFLRGQPSPTPPPPALEEEEGGSRPSLQVHSRGEGLRAGSTGGGVRVFSAPRPGSPRRGPAPGAQEHGARGPRGRLAASREVRTAERAGLCPPCTAEPLSVRTTLLSPERPRQPHRTPGAAALRPLTRPVIYVFILFFL